MKKRLISLLVALCMAVTLLPVSAITAWAEESSSNSTTLRIKYGYPVDSGKNHDQNCSGDDWSYDGTTKTLKLNPTSPTEYDFSSLSSDGNTLNCALEIGAKATITSGSFTNDITNHGIVSGGTFSPIEYVKPCLTFANYGIITDGTFYAPFNTPSTSFKLSNYRTIEGGNFRNSSSNFSFSNQGSINGGIFSTAPDKSIKLGYILKCSGQLNNIFDATCYVIPNTNSTYPTKITASFGFGALSPFDVTINNTQQMLLTEWAGKVESSSDPDRLYVTFTAPPAKANTVTLSKLTRLVIDKDGYPVGPMGSNKKYSGNGWNFDASNNTLTLESGDYDFSGKGNALNPDVQLVVESGAKLTGGAFKNEPTGEGAGTFKTVTLNGTDSITAVNGLASGDWGNTLYAVKTGNNTITASKPILDINRILLESVYPNSSNKNTVCINIKSLNSVSAFNPEADIILNQASHGLPLIMASNGTPVIVNAPFEADGGYYTYYGDGWHIQKSSEGIGTLYLTGGKTYDSYNFRFTDPVNKNGQLDAVNCGIVNEYGIIEDGIFNTPVANGWPKGDSTKTHKIEGGTFAAGLLYNDGVITGGAFNGKDSVLNKLLGSTVVSDTALSGDYRSVTVNGGAILKVNDTHPLVPGETGSDLVQGSAWDLYSYADTVLTVESNVDITNINGQKIGNAFGSYYLNGETDKTVVCFEMPDSDVELNSTKIVDPDPKPEPKPDPTPETYTLTVKGGTFTYNGGEAMTSASVPVDAEVKVTLNQSAVPEGMVFDLWAMDEASLLGNPAVAYNQESFTIPAGSVAKGSTVTVEAQYRDATIESEPSILGTAAIIGVAGAGTAVIVWQGYRIGMELYEKYFQPTPEETAAEQPAPEAPAAAAAS